MVGTDRPEDGSSLGAREAKATRVRWAVHTGGSLAPSELHWDCGVWAHTEILWEIVSVNTAINHSRERLYRTLQPNWAQGEFHGKSPEEAESLISAKRIYYAPGPTGNAGTLFPNL